MQAMSALTIAGHDVVSLTWACPYRKLVMYRIAQVYKNALKQDQHPLNWPVDHWYNMSRSEVIARFKRFKQRAGIK